jgi:hypothetical protein
MKSIQIYVPVIVSMFLLTSCAPSLVPFTQQLREQNNITPEELKSIQFYFSNDFVLRRGENTATNDTKKGELTVLKDSKVEEIIIKAGTPCVVKQVVDGNRVTVGFEDKGNKYLVFGSVNNRDGYYTLMALEWKNGLGEVNYGEQTYYSSKGSKDVFLALKMKSLEKFKLEQKVVKGAVVQ